MLHYNWKHTATVPLNELLLVVVVVVVVFVVKAAAQEAVEMKEGSKAQHSTELLALQ